MLKKILIYSVLIASSFFMGTQWMQFQYDDICLDLGGGKNPQGSPICVLFLESPPFEE
ncbi:hypothetical protein PCNPT3_04825 [Psychromonas sp. CNPT3]|uniref:hypothetical protein n=1 Tax=Psychromonas sp. CNPT3 TaxID=314282 RepID=UPI00006E9E24|nr:hypothetical protein [Psychromonas sp. CNPT3]AGH80907.1 hypothetical protein PCNPT3_04825 [Psychromonas sp. CNPT3]